MNIIKFDFEGHQVDFNGDGWINATEVANQHNKRLDVWLKSNETQDYIEALMNYLNTTKRWELIKTKRGKLGGIWLHLYSPNNKPTADDVGALAATKKMVNNVPIYMVDNDVNYTGKLTVNDKTVLTEDDKFKIESMILYPGGDESNPPTVVRNQRIVVDNPFNTINVLLRLELYLESTWFDFQQLDNVGTAMTTGVRVNVVGNDKIVIQSGNYEPCVINTSIMGGHPFGTNKTYTSAQYRIRIIKLGD